MLGVFESVEVASFLMKEFSLPMILSCGGPISGRSTIVLHTEYSWAGVLKVVNPWFRVYYIQICGHDKWLDSFSLLIP